MTAFLRLLILAPLAYIFALIAAAGTVSIALFSGQLNEQTAMIAVGMTLALTLYGGMITFIPALIVVIVAEVNGWRSIVFYVLAGGAIGLLAAETTMAFDGLSFAGQLRLICVAGGFVGGAVYWLIAGKLAGAGDPPASRPA